MEVEMLQTSFSSLFSYSILPNPSVPGHGECCQGYNWKSHLGIWLNWWFNILQTFAWPTVNRPWSFLFCFILFDGVCFLTWTKIRRGQMNRIFSISPLSPFSNLLQPMWLVGADSPDAIFQLSHLLLSDGIRQWGHQQKLEVTSPTHCWVLLLTSPLGSSNCPLPLPL